jgi:hypothetical protein
MRTRADVERLFADHAALAADHQRRGAERTARLQAAALAEKDAYAVEDRAWEAWDTVRDHVAERPGDARLVAAADQAEADYDTARRGAYAARTVASELARQLIAESQQDTERLLELGRLARTTQDAVVFADPAAGTDTAGPGPTAG